MGSYRNFRLKAALRAFGQTFRRTFHPLAIRQSPIKTMESPGDHFRMHSRGTLLAQESIACLQSSDWKPKKSAM